MRLKELKEHFENMTKGAEFNFKLSEPFPWRGSYDEVCFSIEEIPSTREEALINIDMAFDDIFIGWKGGEYQYNDWTEVNFADYENKLVNLAFKE